MFIRRTVTYTHAVGSALHRFLAAAAMAAILVAGITGGTADIASAAEGHVEIAQGQGAPQGRMPGRGAPRAIRLQVAPVMDPTGFAEPMVAVVALIPAGWRTRGGVVWGKHGTCGTGYKFDWQASSPDGAMAAAVFPSMQWSFSNFPSQGMPGCPTLRISNIRQYLQFVVQRGRQGARILDFRRRPDIEKNYRHLDKVTPMPMGEIRSWVEAGEVLIGYNAQGREVRETVAALVSFSLNRMRGAYPGQVMETLTGAAETGYTFRAPHGYLDARLAETIRSSFKANPKWLALINQHNAKIARSNIAHARKRAQITAQTYDEIRRMNRESYEYRNRVMDRTNRQFSEAIRGVNTYNDPMSPTGEVQLDNQYRHACRLNDGTYVLTDQEDFNPFAVFGQDGTKLRQQQ
ncbi:MAG: hypothetical protein OEO83_17360 [Alphaproteobacteria bacterium]|nr:hypothetical protein [Alphaproteobacteria bacterium]